MTRKHFFVFLKSYRNGEQTQRGGASLAASAPCACVCTTERPIVCSNVAAWQSHDWKSTTGGKHKYQMLSQQTFTREMRVASTTECDLKWKRETAQTATAANLTSHAICSASPPSAARSRRLVAPEDAGGAPQGKTAVSADFHFHARQQSVGGRDRPLLHCPPGDQMKASGFRIPS